MAFNQHFIYPENDFQIKKIFSKLHQMWEKFYTSRASKLTRSLHRDLILYLQFILTRGKQALEKDRKSIHHRKVVRTCQNFIRQRGIQIG